MTFALGMLAGLLIGYGLATVYECERCARAIERIVGKSCDEYWRERQGK